VKASCNWTEYSACFLETNLGADIFSSYQVLFLQHFEMVVGSKLSTTLSRWFAADERRVSLVRIPSSERRAMETREFHLGDILTITTGRLVSLRHMEGVYDILNFMTRDNLFTHQLPRASEECKPYLLRQHPQLADIEVPELNESNCQQWLAEQVAKYGEYLPVEQIPMDDHTVKNPIEEAAEMMGGKDKVIVVETD